MKDRRVTIVVHTDGELESHEYRLPLWAFHVGKWSALTVGLAIVLFFAFAGPIGRAAARAPVLEREVARLREENGRVQQLAGALNRAEASYQELRALLGVKAPPEQAVAANADLMRAVSVRASAPDAPARRETGPVRAAGGGVVQAAGTDPAYGLFVLVRHPEGYETIYGHASRLLVHEGDSVRTGQVIALSGSSGRSTAPHLHFEIRREGRSLDPLTVVKREN